MNHIKDTILKYCGLKGYSLTEDELDKDLATMQSLTKTNDTTVSPDTQEQSPQKLEIKKSNDVLQQITVEIVAEPETPDAHGQWYSKDTIAKGFASAEKAVAEGRMHMNLFHVADDVDNEHIELVKQYLVPFDCEVNGESVKEGSWIAEVRFKSSELFKKRTTVLEDGTTEIAGLSLRGWGDVHKPKNEDE